VPSSKLLRNSRSRRSSERCSTTTRSSASTVTRTRWSSYRNTSGSRKPVEPWSRTGFDGSFVNVTPSLLQASDCACVPSSWALVQIAAIRDPSTTALPEKIASGPSCGIASGSRSRCTRSTDEA
jgi:hypothetical protein